MEVKFGIAKIGKYATSESGDTVELIERPHGGVSLVLVDGQRSGRPAKKISNLVARKAIQLLAEGVRDGAAARAAHDYLYTYRGGKVSATLNIVSVDAVTQTLVVSRNNDAPVIVHTPQRGLFLLDEPSDSIGTRRNTKPVITEIPVEVGPLVIAFTDGLRHAGSWHGGGANCFDPTAATRDLLTEGVSAPQEIADRLLEGAVEMDDGRPRDDISVVVVAVSERASHDDDVRRLSGRMPI
ncbi:MAG: SpoIIE family protein phosphatase [Candidatus Promineifilaceae bacterium]|nr:SpoIIE family protein phosphatase [Candidatus Promineifilaceae bacterium]